MRDLRCSPPEALGVGPFRHGWGYPRVVPASPERARDGPEFPLHFYDDRSSEDDGAYFALHDEKGSEDLGLGWNTANGVVKVNVVATVLNQFSLWDAFGIVTIISNDIILCAVCISFHLLFEHSFVYHVSIFLRIMW